MNFFRARAAEGRKGCRQVGKVFLITLAMFAALCALSHIGFSLHYGSDAGAMENDLAMLGSMLEDKGVITDAGTLSVGAIFFNNARVAAIGFALGLVPFLFLPALLVVSNAVVLGMATSMLLLLTGRADLLVASLLPHGIIELPALLLAVSMGFSLCVGIIRLIFRRQTAMALFERVSDMAWGFFLYILPLLWVASIIECYITPLVAAAVMG